MRYDQRHYRKNLDLGAKNNGLRADLVEVSCTRKQIRTATPFQAPPPQDGASTNFATRVYCRKDNFIQYTSNLFFSLPGLRKNINA
jgi:hypothetical protein